jgi:hypothetical protein
MRKFTHLASVLASIILLTSNTLYAQTTLFSEDFETQFSPNTNDGPNAPLGWTQVRSGFIFNDPPSLPGTDGAKDWAIMEWGTFGWQSNTLPNIAQAPFPVTTGLIPPSQLLEQVLLGLMMPIVPAQEQVQLLVDDLIHPSLI